MRQRISIPPPAQFQSYSPSQLFKYFYQLGRWTEESLSADLQNFTRGILVSSVTINKWKNHDVIPKRYSGPLFKLIEAAFEPAVANRWTQAFEIVWAAHLARSNLIQNQSEEILDQTEIADRLNEQHSRWIRTLYAENLFGEKFSTQDLYVPLQLIEAQGNDLILYENEDVLNLFAEKEAQRWTSISGGAGSGKSMLALHLAQELSKTDITPIYMRGQHVSNIEIDIRDPHQPVIDSFSAKSFLRYFRASSKKAACLILDGVSRIPGPRDDALNFLSSLSLEQNICEAHGKTLSVVIFAREIDRNFMTYEKITPNIKHLEILGLDGRYKQQGSKEEIAIGKDMRPVWWKAYLGAIGRKIDTPLPDFLFAEYADFQEFGANPLWAHLICQTALANETDASVLAYEAVNKFTYSENTNLFYQKIVNYICDQNVQRPIQNPEAENNFSLLQNIALKHWRQSHEDTATSAKTNDIPPQGDAIDFPHDNLSHYLVSTLIVDRFVELLNAGDDTVRFNEALLKWVDLSTHGKHCPILADFCQKEASLRYMDIDASKLDFTFSIITDKINASHFDGNCLDTVSNILNSGSLLFFVWSCFNLERTKSSGAPHKISKSPKEFNFSTVRQLYQSNYLNFQKGSLIEPSLGRDSFLAPSLSALHLSEADFSQLSFGQGHIDLFQCEKSSFAMSYWSQVKITASSFKRSTFQQTTLHGCRWKNSTLSACLFQGASLQNSTFLNCDLSGLSFSQCHFNDVHFLSSRYESLIFDRCIFTNCSFDTHPTTDVIEGIEFRYCTFLSMKKSLQKLPKASLKDCIFQAASEAPELEPNKTL